MDWLKKGMRDGERLGEETMVGLNVPGLEEGARVGWEVGSQESSGLLLLEPSRGMAEGPWWR